MEEIILRKLCYGVKRENKNYIEFVYGSDEKFSLAVGISMSSIREHNESCIFHWFVTQLSHEDLERVKCFSDKYGVVCNIYYINQKLVNTFPHNDAWSTAMYYRILAVRYLKDTANRLLYLDGDTYCRHDLSQLYNLNLHDNIIAAVRDKFPNYDAYKKRMQYIGNNGDGYFNSGVLLIDVKRWNSEYITEKALKYLEDNPKRWENAPDQDVLNVLLANKVEWIDQKYNVLNSVVYGDINSSCIIHFIGPKPWLSWYISEGNTAFDKEYYKTMNQSEWKDISLQQPHKTVEYRYMSKKYFKNREWCKGLQWHFKYLIRKIYKTN